MIIDQDCQTKMIVAKFWVSSLGECGRKSDVLPCSCLNMSNVYSNLTRQHFQGKKVPSTDEFLIAERDKNSELGKIIRKAVADEWDNLYKKHLKAFEYSFLKKVVSFQKEVNDSRFRVYGEICQDGEEIIVVVTEFAAFCDDEEFWTKLNELSKSSNAHVWVMREEPYLDRYYPARGEEGEQVTDEPCPGTGGYWVRGKNHGRVERQVELSWRCESLSIEQLLKFVDQMTETTESIWKDAGVGVL